MASPNPWPLNMGPRTPKPNPPGSLHSGVAQAPMMAAPPMLTVSDVERLAKAGVVIKFEDITNQVRSDPAKEPHSYVDPALAQAIVNRWMIANSEPNLNRSRPPFDLACSKYKDKVYVFASYWGNANMPMANGTVATEPCVLIDDIAMFPSDALMAKLIFLKEQAK